MRSSRCSVSISAADRASCSSRPARITCSHCWMRWPVPGSIRAMRSFVCRSRRTSVFISWIARSGSVWAEAMNVVVAGHEALGVGHRLDRGGARPRLDQAHLAEHVAGRQDPEALRLAPLPMLTSTEPAAMRKAVSPASPSEGSCLRR